jgi:hypothetical protein
MRISQIYNLNKSQAELDFVDVSVSEDTLLFVDPFAITQQDQDPWSIDCHNLIHNFFQEIIDLIRQGNDGGAKTLLNNLHEPRETRLGFSLGLRGSAIGNEQAGELYESLKASRAIETGLIKDIEDCALLIEGIDKDKISDITTNIIKKNLAEYTQAQCLLHGIPTQKVSLSPFWNPHTKNWNAGYFDLPVHENKQILFVPKAIIRWSLEYNYKEYYQHQILDFLEEENIRAGSSLVKTLKSGKKKVLKKDLKLEYPLSKKFVFDFSVDHPDVLDSYRQTKRISTKPLSNRRISKRLVEPSDINFDDLKTRLREIPKGAENASVYHTHMVGVVEALFYPDLIHPKKEHEIHDGRKRIDIFCTNAAKTGFFATLAEEGICPFVIMECKNYTSEIANPELDQIAGRFSPRRGRFGIIFCRDFENKAKFYTRCKDTASDDRGFIIALDDNDVCNLLDFKKMEDDEAFDAYLENLYRLIV